MRLHRIALSANTPVERGLEYAAAAGSRIVRTVDTYWEHYLRLGGDAGRIEEVALETLTLLSDWSSEQAEEVRGLADGTGLPAWRIVALMSRTEVLATLQPGTTECSTVVLVPNDGPARSLQTWDWDPALAPEGALLDYTLSSGTHVSTFTELGMTAKIGVSSRGLGLHFNILHHRSDDLRPGVPVHCLAREVLSRSTTVAEAREIAESTPVSASSVLTVLTADDAAALEVSPVGVAALQPVPVPGDPGGSRALWHTNHFLDPSLARGEARTGPSTTHERARHLDQQLRLLAGAAPGLHPLAAAMCGEAGAHAPVCLTPGPADAGPWSTLLTAGITLDPPCLTAHPGTPATVPHDLGREAVSCID